MTIEIYKYSEKLKFDAIKDLNNLEANKSLDNIDYTEEMII